MKKLLFLFIFISGVIMLRAQDGRPFKSDEIRAIDKKDKLNNFFYMLMFPNWSFRAGIDEYGNSKGRIGGEIGAGIVVHNFSPTLSLRTELIYSMQGYKTGEDGEPGYSSSGSTRLNYLNIPVIGHYQTEGGFFAEAGLQPGLLLSAKSKYSVTSTGGSSSSTENVKDNFNTFDMGVPIGIGYEFKNGIGLGVRVVPGLSNINKTTDTYEAPKQHNMVVALRASYTF